MALGELFGEAKLLVGAISFGCFTSRSGVNGTTPRCADRIAPAQTMTTPAKASRYSNYCCSLAPDLPHNGEIPCDLQLENCRKYSLISC